MHNYHVVEEKEFSVIGIVLRTTNAAAINEGSIGQHWQRFFSEDVLSQVPNKVDNAIVALYYGYESDRNSSYNLLVGARVTSTDSIPAGMVAHQVAAQKRAVFVSEQGPKGQVCFGLWKKIWSLEDQHVLKRSYDADYELYDERSTDPNNAIVEIHIAVQ